MPHDDDVPRGLEAYRAKRDPGATPEPFGSDSDRPQLFMVHKHHATNLHYDLRLEHRGVLLSFAVPRGPSLDPKEKRFAAHVEDHPVDYGDFEGMIPAGNYGAGPTLVWDRGRWYPVEDVDEGLRSGKLLFDLYGHKLKGQWTLVRTARGPTDWLLIKKPDAFASSETVFDETSVLSGLTVDELRGNDRAERLRAHLRELGAPERLVDPASVRPMLAKTADAPFSDPAWVFEIKYDGFRLLVGKQGDRVRAFYRSGREATDSYPDVVLAVRSLPYHDVILDAEVTVHDERGYPSFQQLQRRTQLVRKRDIDRATVFLPATLYAFDLLAVEGFDLRDLPLLTRKEVLRRVVPTTGLVRYSDHIPEQGEAMFAQARELGLEGIMAKEAASPYRTGRSERWLKMPVTPTGEFAIVGFSAPKSGRTGFGALHLAVWEGGRLVYAGKVGSGFSEELLVGLHARLVAARRDTPACEGAPGGADETWVEPELVCEVRYREFTDEALLRQPVFLGLRPDKRVSQAVRSGDAGQYPEEPDEVAVVDDPTDRRVPYSNLSKVFWPDEGYTKGDLIAFYRDMAPFMMPYLVDRPLVLTRYPDGITGKSFYQKDAPRWVPEWVRTVAIRAEGVDRDIHYFIADDALVLEFLANMGTIPIHVWCSRFTSIDLPDWSIIDLDPKGAPFTDVVRIARFLRELCDDIGLPSFVKTSGSTGLHVLVPLGRAYDYDQSRLLARLLSQVAVNALGDIATLERGIGSRQGKVYLDWLQNRHGQLLVAPFSVRPLPGAPVSTPLAWDEVNADLRLSDHTIRTVPERFARLGADPFRPVLDTAVDLGAALGRLAVRLGG